MSSLTRFLTPLAVALAATGCFNQVRGNGDRTQKTHEVKEFEDVVARNGFEVEIRVDEDAAADAEIRVEADSNLHKHIEIWVEGSTLFIDTEDDLNLSSSGGLEVSFTVPALRSVEAEDGVELSVVGLNERDFSVDASDGSDVEVTGEAISWALNSEDGSSIDVIGAGRDAEIRSADGSSIDARELELEVAEVSAQDGSSVHVCATGELFARARDGADIRYYCSPENIDRDSSDGSSISAGD